MLQLDAGGYYVFLRGAIPDAFSGSAELLVLRTLELRRPSEQEEAAVVVEDISSGIVSIIPQRFFAQPGVCKLNILPLAGCSKTRELFLFWGKQGGDFRVGVASGEEKLLNRKQLKELAIEWIVPLPSGQQIRLTESNRRKWEKVWRSSGPLKRGTLLRKFSERNPNLPKKDLAVLAAALSEFLGED